MHEQVTIGVITFRRPAELKRLLDALELLAFDVVEVLVVDNDPEGSASDVVSNSALRPRYVCEPNAGTSFARNRLMDECSTPWLASLDDDEVPSAGWLAGLLDAADRFGADLVAGPVNTEFLQEPSPWVFESGIFDRPNPATGTELPNIRGGNLLVNLEVVRSYGIRYDTDFNKGGQDIQFSAAAAAAGAKIVWTQEAPIVEYVGGERLTNEWVIDRWTKTYCNYWRARLRAGDASLVAVSARGLFKISTAAVSAAKRSEIDARRDLAHARGAFRAVAQDVRERRS